MQVNMQAGVASMESTTPFLIVIDRRRCYVARGPKSRKAGKITRISDRLADVILFEDVCPTFFL